MRIIGFRPVALVATFSASALSVTPSLAQTTPAQARAALEAQYPTVRFYEKGERVRTVYGARMTRGNTHEGAAEAWLAVHGAVFGTDQPDMQRFRSIPLPDGERTVLMYKQRMDGLPVIGSSLRILVRGESPAQVVYTAGRIAIRPQGGLPAPTVSPAEALAAARAHPQGALRAHWSEPELVAIYDNPPNGNAEAYPAWRLVGTGPELLDSYSFYVDAVTGRVARIHSNVVRGTDDIIGGNVVGHATPGLKPDTWGNTNPPTGTQSCPNPAVQIALEGVLVEARLPGFGTLVDATYTDANGDYELVVPSSTTVDVFAHLGGDHADLYSDTFSNWPAAWGDPLDPLEEKGLTAPASGVDFDFGASEADVSRANAHDHIRKTLEYLAPTYSIPKAPIITSSFLYGAYVAEGF